MHDEAILQQRVKAIAEYWNRHIHDLEIATHPVGSAGFFAELDTYRYEKLDYLPRIVEFPSFRGLRLLEIGCGVGTDLVRFIQAGAHATGIDLATVSIALAQQNLIHQGLAANLCTMDGEELGFADNTFDAVYAHGVLQYTADPEKMVQEIYRVLAPGGKAVLMVYNRYSWLNLLSKVSNVGLEHEDAPVLRKFSIGEFRRLLKPFCRSTIIPERFPVHTRLHHGWKAALYNQLFVSTFERIPRSWVRLLGWHLIGIGYKCATPV